MTELTLETQTSADRGSAGVPRESDPAAAYGTFPRFQTVIRPVEGWQLLNLAELWRHRELLYFFTWRDVKVRYKQTLLGASWAILQPFMMMIVFTIFLGQMAQVDSGSIPYPVFVYAGLLPWTFFANATSNAGNSLVMAQQIITKVYFPRLAVPLACVGAAMVDFVIAFAMLIALMLFYGYEPTWSLLLVPPLLALAALAASGAGTLLSALNVAYRDFKYTIPFLIQLWMFATPTVYMNVDNEKTNTTLAASEFAAETKVPASAGVGTVDESKTGRELTQFLLRMNPMVGLIAFFRASVLGTSLPWQALADSTVLIVVMFLVGLTYFRRVEAWFADII